MTADAVTVRLSADEWYPVYIEDDESGLGVEIPEPLWQNYSKSLTAFTQARRELLAYFSEERRLRQVAEHQAALALARQERGRQRHFRRPRPR